MASFFQFNATSCILFISFSLNGRLPCFCSLTSSQSGTSIKGKPKVHSISDKKMKSLINTCAVGAVQHDKELRSYYLRRIEEGKPKMLVLNIVRNKIIARAFAVIERGTSFVELNQFAA